MSDEQEILFLAKPSLRRAFFYAFLFAALVVYGRFQTDLDPELNKVWLGCLGVMLVLLFIAMLFRWTTTYIITSDEVQRFSGILARRTVIVPLMRITNASANQTFLERILGLANVQIDSAGGDTTEMQFTRILKVEANEAARIVREFMKTGSASARKEAANDAS